MHERRFSRARLQLPQRRHPYSPCPRYSRLYPRAALCATQDRITLEAMEAFPAFAQARAQAAVTAEFASEGFEPVAEDELQAKAREVAALAHAEAVRARQLDHLAGVAKETAQSDDGMLDLLRRTRDGPSVVPLTVSLAPLRGQPCVRCGRWACALLLPSPDCTPSSRHPRDTHPRHRVQRSAAQFRCTSGLWQPRRT